MAQEYFSKHLSLSQWAIDADIINKNDLIKEDATKRDRLAVLNERIDLPIVKVHSFIYEDIRNNSSAFSTFFDSAGDHLYALRASPREDGLAVQRNRKLTVRELLNWILSLDIELEKYDFNFELHIDPEIASIFIVSDKRIAGEVIPGGILQLNKGLHGVAGATQFQYDFMTWKYSGDSTLVGDFLERAVRCLFVANVDNQRAVEKEVEGAFTNNYLKGYFEVISSTASGIVFIDYNRVLQNNIDGLELFHEHPERTEVVEVTGQVGCAGTVIGKARVVTEQDITGITLTPEEVLVCHYTSPDFVPLIRQAVAVVTDVGGILSHAAIVCRELKKPCVIGTRIGTQRIKTGDNIEVDAINGRVKLL
jgi:phosphohistidine swiveling domain-containing protein